MATTDIKLDIPTQYACSPHMSRMDDGATGLDDVSQVAQHVFGRLVKLATDSSSADAPGLANFHSDLWHDAMWIREYLTGTRFTFWFGYDESGTHIGTDPIIVPFRRTFYHVTVDIRADRLGARAYMTMARVIRPEGWRK